jgi:hypothetical protein
MIEGPHRDTAGAIVEDDAREFRIFRRTEAGTGSSARRLARSARHVTDAFVLIGTALILLLIVAQRLAHTPNGAAQAGGPHNGVIR